MSNGPNNPRPEKYVLKGRAVTMDDVLGVEPDAAIYIDGNKIVAVSPTDPIPQGFENAPRIETGGTIYPGLIELHNHLCYNAMPLWAVEDTFTNNGQWRNGRGSDAYRCNVSKPAQVLAKTPEKLEALVRFVECKCLLGGVTTSQGITLYSVGGAPQRFEGIVRNVERPLDGQLDPAGTRIGNPPTKEEEVKDYLENLEKQTCYLQHISEGKDDTARGWFERLKLPGGEWAITEAFSGIHCTAFEAEHYAALAAKKASMVWSPLSNYLLYNKTNSIQAAHDAGIDIAIGSDWAPTGSKNLLGELKVAWLVNQEEGANGNGVFTAKEIVEMATINAARILTWDALLGSIAPGKLADLIVIEGTAGDDYMRLIEARETSIILVIIDGVARAGTPALMVPFGPHTESWTVGGSQRRLNLEHEATHPEVAALSLAEATEVLEEAMQNLPELAEDLDKATDAGVVRGVADNQGTEWQVGLDFDEEDRARDPFLFAAALYAEYVTQPMELEGITVMDDPSYLSTLAGALNMPLFLIEKLPPLYEEEAVTPEAPGFLEDEPAREELPEKFVFSTQNLRTFLETWCGPSLRRRELTLKERLTIVDQALVLLEQNYVHLPFKRAMHAIDPVQRLRLLRYRMQEEDELRPELEFHREMIETFNSLRDLHTTYRLPSPFKWKCAWLPFLIEECWTDDGQHVYVVSKVVGTLDGGRFEPGVQVLYWNGMPIDKAVAQNADRQPGGNPAARHARGLDAMTIRPLASTLPPEEEWVTIRYRDSRGRKRNYRQDWLVSDSVHVDLGRMDPEARATEAAFVGLDARTFDIQEIKKVLYGKGAVGKQMEAKARDRWSRVKLGDKKDKWQDTTLPTVFRAKCVPNRYGRFGYVRIFTFNVWDAGEFVDEFVHLVGELERDGGISGLIIDVRGNGGGLIPAAEQLLQVLTPHRIQPESAQFINSPLNLQICRNQGESSTRFPTLDLEPWIESIAGSVETGASHSDAFPITSLEPFDDLCQKYYGRVLLIVDALCYSATDMFAAGFRDHGIGPILHIHQNTGAGGANVWPHWILRQLMVPNSEGVALDSPYRFLPHGVDLRVAIRRTLRVGAQAGTILEDLGVRPDPDSEVYHMKGEDVLGDNEGLMEEATRRLSKVERHWIGVEPLEDTWPKVVVNAENVTRLDLYVNGRPAQSLDVSDERPHTELGPIELEAVRDGLKIEVQAFRGDRLVCRWRGRVEPGQPGAEGHPEA